MNSSMKKKENQIDASLVISFQNGNKEAANLLVKRWHIQFCKLAFWICKDADLAKDIAQESWVIIFEKLHNLKDPKKFKSWCISIVNRKTIDWIRTKNRENKKLNSLYEDSDKTSIHGELEEDKTKLLSILKTAIEGLSSDQKMIVTLFYLENYSLKLLSETLHISVGTAKSRLFHAREKLKKSLKHRTEHY